MKLQFLGSGTAFTNLNENFNSNMALESSNGKRLMIDCGSDARHSTAALNLTSKDFDAVFISHCHADHAGGLEWMAFTTKFDPTANKPKLIVHPTMVDMLWNNVLSGGLLSLEEELCTLETYFDMHPVTARSFVWESIEFEFVRTTHIFSNHVLVPSFGLFFTNHRTNVYITTDTQFTPEQYMEYYQRADVIFHDCETTPFKSGVHTHFTDLDTYPDDIKAKMWLYHYSATNNLPDPIKHGFKGFVQRGQVFEF